jgi:hypothetical protein
MKSKVFGTKVHQDGVKPTNFLEWRSVISLYEVEANMNLMVQLRESFETP